VPRSKAHDRDLGIRKISSATRILAGAGIVFVGAFSAFLASRASSSAGQSVTSTPVTSPAQRADGGGDTGTATTPYDSSQYQPRYQPAPQAHTRSGSS
jgi:hypothetical protein